VGSQCDLDADVLGCMLPEWYLLPSIAPPKQHVCYLFAPETASHWLLAGMMAFAWLASLLLYGVSAAELGELGSVLGWPLFETIIVTTASVLGVLTGEWKSAAGRPLKLQLSGVAVLIASIIAFSRVR
jgi:hypothetical protein